MRKCSGVQISSLAVYDRSSLKIVEEVEERELNINQGTGARLNRKVKNVQSSIPGIGR